MTSLDTATKQGVTYDSTWETMGNYHRIHQETGNMAWYYGCIIVVALNIALFISIIVRSQPIVQKNLTAKEKAYTLAMWRLSGVFLTYALYSAVFPSQYISYFVWWDTVLSCQLVAWIMNSAGQMAACLQVYYAVLYGIFQAYSDDVKEGHRPSDSKYPTCAKIQLGIYVMFYGIACGCSGWGLVAQDWSKFLMMTFCRLIACIFALMVTLKLYCVAKMLREKAGKSGVVACDSWTTEPMAFLMSVYFIVAIIWFAAFDIPKAYEHFDYQNAAQVPTLEFPVGFDEALNHRTYARVSSVWPDSVLIAYFISIAVGSTIALLMAAAPRLGKYEKSSEAVAFHLHHFPDPVHDGGGDDRTVCMVSCSVM
jgi:hypothetical protein